jgi:hypothetical protein
LTILTFFLHDMLKQLLPDATVTYLEAPRLLMTLVVDVICTMFLWNGELGSGYATAAIVFKDWVSSVVFEDSGNNQTGKSDLSDMYRDIHCFCDTIVCVALSFYEAQTSINENLDVGFRVKIAMAVGCALHLPIWACLCYLGSKALKGADEKVSDAVSAIFSTSLQLAAWALAVSVAGGANSVELALVAVALHKLSVYISQAPHDDTKMKWIRGFLFALATGVQVIVMNAQLQEPGFDECVTKCQYDDCRIGVSVISKTVKTLQSSNNNSVAIMPASSSNPNSTFGNSTHEAWPKKLTLPTDRVSGWLILNEEGVCAHELMLTPAQQKLFLFWTVLMSIGGLVILADIVLSMSKESSNPAATPASADLVSPSQAAA